MVLIASRYFADQPFLSHPDITDRHLVLYAFEDFLKKWFFNLLQVLEVSSRWLTLEPRTAVADIIRLSRTTLCHSSAPRR